MWRNLQSAHATNVTGELTCVRGVNDKPGESKQNTVHAMYRVKVALRTSYLHCIVHT